MSQNSLIMVQTIEQIEDFHRSIQTVEQKLSETSKLMMLLLETPGDLPADFVRLLAKTLELKIDMTSGVKEENFAGSKKRNRTFHFNFN